MQVGTVHASHHRWGHWKRWCYSHTACRVTHRHELWPKKVPARIRVADRGMWINAEITAYCPCGGINGGGTTANGTGVYHGEIAAPPQYAFGTRFYIPGYGVGVVEDRGGVIYGNHFDLGMDSLTEANNWGVRYENIELLN